MAYKLLIDKRERDVLKHESEFADVDYEAKQMEIADYIIMKGDKVAFAIERKSWSDFAASIKDGRHNNKSKMMALRTQTGCGVFYIVEGELVSNPNKLLGRIPYKVMESAMFHMQVRDNIQIIRTASTLDTAKVLVRFIRSLGTLKDAPKHDHQQGLVEGADENGIPLALTQRVAKSDIDVVRELWSGFRSITASSADYLIEQYSVADFVRGDVANIAKIKFSNGRTINKPMARSLSAITHTVEIRLLGKIPMVSAETAKELLRATRLKTLLSYGEEGIAMRTVKGGRKLGATKAGNIIKYFNYKKGCEDGAAAGAAAADADNTNDADDNADDATNDIAVKKPTAKRVVAKKPTVKKPAVKKAAAKPIAKKPTVKRTTAKRVVAKTPLVREVKPVENAPEYKDDGTIGFDDE